MKDKAPTKEMVQQRPASQIVLYTGAKMALPDWLKSTGAGDYLTNIDASNDAGFSLANRAAVGLDAKLYVEVGKEFVLTNFYLRKWEGEDEQTGEPKSSVRIALVDSEGMVHVTYSEGVKESLMLLIGRGSLPVRVKVCEVGVTLRDGKPGRKIYLDLA